MSFKDIIFTKEGPIATILLNRPGSFNALNLGIAEDMAKALEICEKDREIRVVVLTGNGKSFCSGGDIKSFEEYAGTEPDKPIRQLLDVFHRVILDIRKMPKPVLAAINGATGGAGISLALACDLRIASALAKFKLAFTSLGLTPDSGSTLFLGLMVGFARTSEMIFLDPVYDAEQALAMGLVHKVVEHDRLMEATRQWAEQLAAGATRSFAAGKVNLNHAFLTLLERQLEIERRNVLKSSLTSDYQEGLEAFLTKRKAVFKGC
ncbi:MAG TPA: enoyl-CoA hydratase-related protein [Bacillota bacterium]|nr:enoyl-CoA hydratase-related protein [Bacillota bacterium]